MRSRSPPLPPPAGPATRRCPLAAPGPARPRSLSMRTRRRTHPRMRDSTSGPVAAQFHVNRPPPNRSCACSATRAGAAALEPAQSASKAPERCLREVRILERVLLPAPPPLQRPPRWARRSRAENEASAGRFCSQLSRTQPPAAKEQRARARARTLSAGGRSAWIARAARGRRS